MLLPAYAKINFHLHILGKRADGFHALDSVMVGLGLHDDLTLESASEFQLTCSDSSLPCDDRNLVTKAAKLLAQIAGINPQARLHLEKRVPMGGGLGGGSSDAATALVGLNQLWNLKFSRERLAELAAQLGSDVAFFLWSGWCRCEGRGEIITPLSELNARPPLPLFLIIPPWPVPTPPVYKALNAKPLDPNRATPNHASVERGLLEQLDALAKPNSVSPFSWLENELTHAAQAVEPRLKHLADALEERYPKRWRMSGSGAVHFVLPQAGADPEQLAETLSARVNAPIRVVATETRPALA